jgi:hypothetical protein
MAHPYVMLTRGAHARAEPGLATSDDLPHPAAHAPLETWAHMPQPTHEARVKVWFAIAYWRTSMPISRSLVCFIAVGDARIKPAGCSG